MMSVSQTQWCDQETGEMRRRGRAGAPAPRRYLEGLGSRVPEEVWNQFRALKKRVEDAAS